MCRVPILRKKDRKKLNNTKSCKFFLGLKLEILFQFLNINTNETFKQHKNQDKII